VGRPAVRPDRGLRDTRARRDHTHRRLGLRGRRQAQRRAGRCRRLRRGFAIGHFGGRALALRWGRYVFLTEARLDKAEAFFNRHGAWIITVARFIEGLRQANGIIAGTTGMRWLRFLAFNALGAALWVGTWVSVGYLAGSHIDTIYNYITRYSYYVLIALVVVITALIARHLVRRRRTRKHAPPARARDTDSPE
jgi:membrane protein DedA with SNARE-associated domain